MAKYTVEYRCGCAGEINLQGKHTDRERKLDWLARQDCWKCKRKEEEKLPPSFILRGYTEGVEIICNFNSYGIKDILKSRGYGFGEFSLGALGLLMLDHPVKGWSIKFGKDEEEKFNSEIAWIKESGYEYKIQDRISTLISSVIEGKPELVSK
jgi:hypothetical protein